MYRNGYNRVSIIRNNSYSRRMFLSGANDLITLDIKFIFIGIHIKKLSIIFCRNHNEAGIVT